MGLLRNGKHGHSHKLLCNGKHGHSPKLQCNLDKNRLGRNDLNSTSPHTAGRIPSPALAPTWVPTGHRAFEALEANLETHREASNSSRLGVVRPGTHTGVLSVQWPGKDRCLPSLWVETNPSQSTIILSRCTKTSQWPHLLFL